MLSPGMDLHLGGQPFPTFTTEILLRQIESRPPAFLQDSVKHLFFHHDPGDNKVEAILASCTRITNLCAPFSASPHLLAFGALQCLRRLTISVATLIETALADFPHSVFHNITHLELLPHFIDSNRVQALCTRLPLLPNVTHIAFNKSHANAAFSDALRAAARLECIVFMIPLQEMQNIHVLLAEDSRCVHVVQLSDYRVDWLFGACTGEDYWMVADAFITARRAGRVPREMYSISDRWKIS